MERQLCINKSILLLLGIFTEIRSIQDINFEITPTNNMKEPK